MSARRRRTFLTLAALPTLAAAYACADDPSVPGADPDASTAPPSPATTSRADDDGAAKEGDAPQPTKLTLEAMFTGVPSGPNLWAAVQLGDDGDGVGDVIHGEPDAKADPDAGVAQR